jgi:carboxymethylenebutenolidase
MPAEGISEARAGRTAKIQSSAGGAFDCYVAAPKSSDTAPAIVLASAVHGVDADICAIADEFAASGFLAAAPDLFWRTIPGPLPHDDGRVGERSQPRLDRIKQGERDMTDTLAYLRTMSQFSGAAAVMGFCYGGPYAIIGPKRLGYAAGISCHGTQMLEYVGELHGVRAPICIVWGDRDHRATPEVLDAYRAVPARMSNVELHVFTGVKHGYMMRGIPGAFDQKARDFSMGRAKAMLEALRHPVAAMRAAS